MTTRFTLFVPMLLAAFVAAACSTSPASDSTKGNDTAKKVEMGQQATLRAIGGSAVQGKVRVIDRGDGAVVLLSMMSLHGPYRVAFHERPNCTSPNGFSAGRAWAPPAAAKRAEDLVPILYANSENRVESEVRIPKLHAAGADGVAGRSVVIYAGSDVPEIKPDVPNSAIACGVFEAAEPPAFLKYF